MTKAEKIWLDGKLVNWDDAKVHVLTHALHYGVGVFEGIRAYKTADGRSAVFRLREHMQRLYDSAHIVLMEIPYPIERLHGQRNTNGQEAGPHEGARERRPDGAGTLPRRTVFPDSGNAPERPRA